MKRFTASILVLLGAASFGILSTLVKLGYRGGFTTAQITGSQALFGCIVLWLINIPSFHLLRGITIRTILKLMVSGICTGLVGVFYYLALQTVNASFGVILLFQFVWMGFLVDWFLRKRRPTRQQWFALVVVIIGTILAAGYDAFTMKSLSIAGIVLGLLAAASYTASLNVNGRVALDVPSGLRSAFMMTGATIITLIIFPPQFFFDGSLNRGVWIFAILLGLFGNVIPPFLYARGIPIVGPAMASILGSIELPVVITCSALILQEQVTSAQWLGVLCILLGIFISEQHIRWSKLFRHSIKQA